MTEWKTVKGEDEEGKNEEEDWRGEGRGEELSGKRKEAERWGRLRGGGWRGEERGGRWREEEWGGRMKGGGKRGRIEWWIDRRRMKNEHDRGRGGGRQNLHCGILASPPRNFMIFTVALSWRSLYCGSPETILSAWLKGGLFSKMQILTFKTWIWICFSNRFVNLKLSRWMCVRCEWLTHSHLG